MRDELRKGLAATRPFLLSHHAPEERDRCHELNFFSRQIYLCARCSGIYPGILLALMYPFQLASVPVIALLPLPALIDWAITSFGKTNGSNVIRTVTGVLLGFGYGMALRRLLLELETRILIIGVVYATVAILLIAIERSSEREPTI
ncbi:DUF2085 domain-containing protein [Halostella salina]|uniref:DUF2085 domain-containing protein n=1 Tax=Halostella salina TaxID=1547897 RepID=UPI000EF84ED4